MLAGSSGACARTGGCLLLDTRALQWPEVTWSPYSRRNPVWWWLGGEGGNHIIPLLQGWEKRDAEGHVTQGMAR